MKSNNFTVKILFILLFSALVLFVACGNSDKEDTDTDVSTDEDTATNDNGNSETADSETTDKTEHPDYDENTEITTDNETNPDNDASDAGPDDNDPEPVTDEDGNNETTDNDSDNGPIEGCTAIEVPTITMSGYPDEINGYFSPAMGGSAIDIIKIYLLGDLQEGTYELGTGLNDNYTQCQQCVMVWVDAEFAAAQEYYFQTAGTLTITKVAGEGDAKRTNGNITGLVLKQAETNEHMSDFWFIPNGKCITAERVEWETITDDPSTPGND